MASAQCNWFWKTCRVACLKLQWRGLQLTVGLQSLTLRMGAWLLGSLYNLSSSTAVFHLTMLNFFSFNSCFPGFGAWKAGPCAANEHVLHNSHRRFTPPASLERCCWRYLLPRISASSRATRSEVAWSSERHNDQHSDWKAWSQRNTNWPFFAAYLIQRSDLDLQVG